MIVYEPLITNISILTTMAQDVNQRYPVAPIRYINAGEDEVDLDVINLFLTWAFNRYLPNIEEKRNAALDAMKNIDMVNAQTDARNALLTYVKSLCSSNIEIKELKPSDHPIGSVISYEDFKNIKLYFDVNIKGAYVGRVHLYDIESSITDREAGRVICKAVNMDAYTMSFNFPDFDGFDMIDLRHPIDNKFFEWYIFNPKTSTNILFALEAFVAIVEAMGEMLEFVKYVKRRVLQIKNIIMAFKMSLFGQNYKTNEDVDDMLEFSFAAEEYSVCLIVANDVYCEYYQYDNLMIDVKTFVEKYKDYIVIK